MLSPSFSCLYLSWILAILAISPSLPAFGSPIPPLELRSSHIRRRADGAPSRAEVVNYLTSEPEPGEFRVDPTAILIDTDNSGRTAAKILETAHRHRDPWAVMRLPSFQKRFDVLSDDELAITWLEVVMEAMIEIAQEKIWVIGDVKPVVVEKFNTKKMTMTSVESMAEIIAADVEMGDEMRVGAYWRVGQKAVIEGRNEGRLQTTIHVPQDAPVIGAWVARTDAEGRTESITRVREAQRQAAAEARRTADALRAQRQAAMEEHASRNKAAGREPVPNAQLPEHNVPDPHGPGENVGKGPSRNSKLPPPRLAAFHGGK